MCGIVGIICKNKTGFFANHVKVFEQMLFVDQLRGTHGTGIFYNNKKQKVKTLRAPVPATEFLSFDKYDKANTDIYNESTFAIGHNRFATKGAHSVVNTHPFREGNITLVHNGTLVTHKDIADVEVDSHAICISINKIGAENTLKEIQGAFALVWHDALNNTLNFCRNSERPLALIEHGSGWIICSEEDMGNWIAKRNNIIVLGSKNIPTNTIFSFNLTTMTMTEKPIEVFKKKVSYYQGIGYGSDWDNVLPLSSNLPKKENILLLPEPANETKKQKPNYKSDIIQIGDKIEIVPITISNVGEVKFLDCIKEVKGIEDNIDVRFYCENELTLKTFEKEETLIGTVIAFASGGGQYHIVVRDVFRGCYSKNGLIIRPKDAMAMTNFCHCCGGHFSKSTSSIKRSFIIDGKGNGILEPYCPACTEWTDNNMKAIEGKTHNNHKGAIN